MTLVLFLAHCFGDKLERLIIGNIIAKHEIRHKAESLLNVYCLLKQFR